MANFDDIQGSMQALYEEAQKELVENERKREELLRVISLLGPIYGTGKKTYSVEALKAVEAAASGKAASGRARKHNAKNGVKAAAKAAKGAVKADDAKKAEKAQRVKEEVLRDHIMRNLSEVHPNSMSAAEIFDKLVKAGMPGTKSFQTRVYGTLGECTKENLLERVDRGVYKIVKPVAK